MINILSIKYLESGIKIDQHSEYLKGSSYLKSENCFETIIFNLMEKTFSSNLHAPLNMKIVGQLLSLKSQNITGNILVNFFYYLFRIITTILNSVNCQILGL